MKDKFELYNRQNKEDFLRTIVNSNSRITYLSHFRKSQPFEIMLNKDVGEFSEKDTSNMLQVWLGKSGISDKTVMAIIKTYQKYTYWYNMNQDSKKNTGNIYTLFTKSKILSFDYKDETDKKIMDFGELLSLCNKLNYASQKALVLAVFFGIGRKDLLELKRIRMEDIDLSNNCINIKMKPETDGISATRIIQVPKMLCTNLVEAINETYRDTKLDEFDKSPFKARANRSSISLDAEVRRLENQLKKIKEKTNVELIAVDSLRRLGIAYHFAAQVDSYSGFEEACFNGNESFNEIKTYYNLGAIPGFTIKNDYGKLVHALLNTKIKWSKYISDYFIHKKTIVRSSDYYRMQNILDTVTNMDNKVSSKYKTIFRETFSVIARQVNCTVEQLEADYGIMWDDMDSLNNESLVEIVDKLKMIVGKSDMELLKELQAVQSGKGVSKAEKNNRSADMTRILKELYSGKCQLCDYDNGTALPYIEKMSGEYYCEVHHIKKLGNATNDEEFETLDNYKNAIVVCPFHHKMLHYHHGGYTRGDDEQGKICFLSARGEKLFAIIDKHLK